MHYSVLIEAVKLHVVVCYFCCAVTLLKILACVGYMSISSDDLKHILQLLRVGEEENVVRCCILFALIVCHLYVSK